jgi:hypothetical protein
MKQTRENVGMRNETDGKGTPALVKDEKRRRDIDPVFFV